EKGMDPVSAAIKGVREMAAPVTMAVMTTMLAFAPLLYISGIMGKLMRVIPLVVISVLAVSLIEALLILPAHLSRKKKTLKKGRPHPIAKFHAMIGKSLEWFINKPFAAFAMLAVRWRYVTLSIGITVLLITVGLIMGGRVKFIFMHSVEADNMVASLTMPQGTPIEKTLEVVKKLEYAAEQVKLEFDKQRPDQPSIYKHMATTIGDQPASRGGGGPVRGIATGSSSAHLAEVNIELLEGEERNISSGEIMARWRELVGEVPGVSKLTFLSEAFSPGDAVSVELSHEDFDTLIVVAENLKGKLRLYSGTSDIADDFEPGKAEIKLALKDAGRTLGLTLADLATQARQGFYGQEVQRIQRGRHDVRVMVRYPEDQRKSIAHIENMRVRLPNGAQIPFTTVADVTYGRGYATIRRSERMRTVTVTADVDESGKEAPKAKEINDDLQKKVLPDLMLEYPGLQWRFAGEARERNDSMSSMFKTFPLALLAIYGLLAVQFRSYFQPIIVMSAIPFGIVGATFGHVVMGFDLGILSMFGIIALSGIVVNDSLIMIDLINRERAAGINLHDVVRDSVTRRFRPILLTTMTTFLGLAPMMMEKSLQAQFLIPMAISLAFGVAFATMITLILVPSLYMILEDFWAVLRYLTGKNEKIEPEPIQKTESV
ncbi:MAG: efflux RND transporter permease subunit, partial [Anaerohalosphaera sp.]|nr:efflux RND transporter permease subunit [Anaerohalosphaera sp.]